MKSFLDDDNDFDNHSQNRKPNYLDETGNRDDFEEDMAEDDFDDDDLETENDGRMDSEFDRDIESESADDNNF